MISASALFRKADPLETAKEETGLESRIRRHPGEQLRQIG
jgi:hypothetical protein